MPVCYTNSENHTYYLHQRRGYKGKTKYYFSTESEGSLAESIPEGYEIYENPNARVYLRQIQPKLIFNEEKLIVERGIKNYTNLKDLKIDIDEDIIAIYIADQDLEGLTKSLRFKYQIKTNELFKHTRHYSPILQFILIEHEKRIFLTRRYFPQGQIYDWLQIGKADTLENLVKRYIQHINKDSYFDLE